MNRLVGLRPMLTTAIAILTAAILVQTVQPTAHTSQVGLRRDLGISAPLTWQANEGSSWSQNSSGVLGVKGVLVTASDLWVFYSLYDTIPLPPGQITKTVPVFTAQSCASRDRSACNPLTVSENQLLGSIKIPDGTAIKDYIIGAAKIAWKDDPAQTIKVAATRFNYVTGDSIAWLASPLTQLQNSNLGVLSSEVLQYRSGQPLGIALEVGSTGGSVTFMALKVGSTNVPDLAPIYVKVDRQGAVSVITAAEYAQYTTILPPEPPAIPYPTEPPTPAP